MNFHKESDDGWRQQLNKQQVRKYGKEVTPEVQMTWKEKYPFYFRDGIWRNGKSREN